MVRLSCFMDQTLFLDYVASFTLFAPKFFDRRRNSTCIEGRPCCLSRKSPRPYNQRFVPKRNVNVSQPEQKPVTQRRRFGQFGLKTIGVVCVLVAIPLAWLSYQSKRAVGEQAAINKILRERERVIEEEGLDPSPQPDPKYVFTTEVKHYPRIQVAFNYEFFPPGSFAAQDLSTHLHPPFDAAATEPSGNRFIRKLFGDHVFSYVGLVKLHQFNHLASLDDLAAFERLEHLHLESCNQIKNINAIGKLRKLKTVGICGCGRVPDIEPLAALPELESLGLSGWLPGTNPPNDPALPLDVSPLKNLQGLKRLRLQGGRLENVESLEALTGLEQFEFHVDQLELEQLPDLRRLEKLRCLCISKQNHLTDLELINGLTNLKHIDVDRCDNLASLHGIEQSRALQFLSVTYNLVEDLSPVGSELVYLNVTSSQVKSLEPLRGHSNLQSLYVENCPLENWGALRTLTTLEYLRIGFNGFDLDCNSFQELANLKSVFLSNSSSVSNIDGFESCSKLTHLSLLNCKLGEGESTNLVENLSSIASLKRLVVPSQWLSDEDCASLTQRLPSLDIRRDDSN